MTNKHQPHFCFLFIYYPLNNEQRVHYFVHSAVCTRHAANRSRPAGHEKPVLGPAMLYKINSHFQNISLLNIIGSPF